MDFDWDSFKYDVGSENVVPILGNDLSTIRFSRSGISQTKSYAAILNSGKDEGDSIRINLYDYLAIKLWEVYGKGKPLPDIVNFRSIVTQLLSQAVTIDSIRNVLRNETKKLTNDQILLDVYRKVITINGFRIFVSVNVDNFLERAFEAEGKKYNQVNFYFQDAGTDPVDKPDNALPDIFNLMGNIEWGKFAASDEESLECLYKIKNDTSDKIKYLTDALEGKTLMLIGCSFPDWLMRFFIRIISNETFTQKTRAKYLAGDHVLQDIDLKEFLKNNSTAVLPVGDDTGKQTDDRFENSLAFVNELFNQCNQPGDAAAQPLRYKELVFLSYSRDDSAIAEKFKNEFERNGVNVFYDKDSLKTGGDYDNELTQKIKTCDFFVPLISKHSIENKSRYAYDTEWSFAIAYNDDKNYIRPYIIDDTSPGDENIPERIRKLTINTITNFDDFGPVVRKFIKENNLVPADAENSTTSSKT
jgi:TIR domain/SIR2-like domain